MAEYRGSGGAVFEIAVPEPGTQARIDFDLLIEKGELTLVEPVAVTVVAKTRPQPRKE